MNHFSFVDLFKIKADLFTASSSSDPAFSLKCSTIVTVPPESSSIPGGVWIHSSTKVLNDAAYFLQ